MYAPDVVFTGSGFDLTKGLRSFTPFSPAGAEWRKQRTLLKHALSREVVVRDYSALLARKAKQYVECLFVRPDNFLADLARCDELYAFRTMVPHKFDLFHYCRITGENIVELSYGRLGDEQGRDYVKLNRYVMDVIDVVFEGYMVDLIPACKQPCLPT